MPDAAGSSLWDVNRLKTAKISRPSVIACDTARASRAQPTEADPISRRRRLIPRHRGGGNLPARGALLATGARHIALASRRAAPAEAVAEIEQAGANVTSVRWMSRTPIDERLVARFGAICRRCAVCCISPSRTAATTWRICRLTPLTRAAEVRT
jgi:hypothetical protein